MVTAVAVVAVLSVGATLSWAPPALDSALFGASGPPSPPANGSVPPSVPPGSTNGTAPTPAGGTCNPSTPTPSALLIPLSNPGTPLAAGGSLGVDYELEIVNASLPPGGVTLYVPSTFASFPLAGGNVTQLFVPARSITLAASGWTSPSFANRSAAHPSGLSFDPSSPATLSSEKLAVMGTASYGHVTVEFRWHWYLSGASGTTNGPWSVPTTKSSYPTSLASTFFPAPYVSLLASSGPGVWIGENVTSVLGGAVASSYIFQELENASTGKVFQAGGATAPAGATEFSVGIRMLNYDHYLFPGTYLLHLHDACGAMLYSMSKTASYAPSSNVTVVVTPGPCGPVTIDGSSHANGTTFSLRPSATPYPFSVPTCPGHAFQSWEGGGGIHVAGSGELQVSSDGTFTVRYA